MQQPFATPLVGAAAMRGTGAAIRTAQTIGIEWLDLGKQSYDDFVATMQGLPACRDPGEVLALQSAFVLRVTERILARSVVLSDQFVVFAGHLAHAATRPAGLRRSP